MRKSRLWIFSGILSVGVSLANLGCGGGSSTPPGPTITSVNVSPSGPTTVVIGQTQLYMATVQGTGNFSTSVDWQVNGVIGGNATDGTISATGLYTAPTTIPPVVGPGPATVTVEAVSTEDATKSGSSTVTLGTLNISGSVQTGGPLAGATVSGTSVDSTGSNTGAPLASATSDTSGNFTLMLSTLPPAGPVRITASGGTYTSVADSSLNNPGMITESALLDSVTAPLTGVAVTPLTEFVNSLTVGALNATGPFPGLKPLATVTFTTAHANANALVAKFYGLTPTAVTETLAPSYAKSDISNNPNNFAVGLAIASLATQGKALSQSLSSSTDALIGALSQDYDDGVLDGKGSGPIPLGNGFLNSTAGTTDYLFSVNDCSGSTAPTTSSLTGTPPSCAILNSNGIGAGDLPPIIHPMSSGVQTSVMSPKAFGMTPGSSAALATLSFRGHQYVFLAGRTQGIIVLDVTDPTNIPPPKAWTYLATTTFSTNFVGGVIPVVGTASHPQVLAYATALNHIALVNAEVLAIGTPGTADDLSLVDFETDIPIISPPASFQDGNRVISGGFPDNGRKGVWLATADGYEFFDLSTNALGATAFPVDVGQQLSEHVGGDIAQNLILAGNYVGMQLINLSSGQSFDMDSAFFNANIVPLAPKYYVDTNSVDTTLQVAVGTAVHVPNSFFINMATLTNPTSSTFEPAAGGFAPVQLAVTPNTLDLTGASADPTSHLVLFSGDNTSWVAVGKLQDPASVPAGGQWAGLSDWVFTNADTVVSPSNPSDTYFSASDPPVFGRMFNLAVGKSFGYLLNSDDTFLVQVDMQAFLDPVVTPRAGTTGDAAHEPATDPAKTGVLKAISVP
jgi:hypothetical protein